MKEEKKKKKSKVVEYREPVSKNNDIALEVNDLYISYSSMKKYSVKRNALRGKRAESARIKAVNGVSFTLHKGNVLGIIGANGAGKSTLLRSIAGIFSPDSGEINLHGNTISLLSIGVGFNKELTGRENIILSSMLLGFPKETILEKMDEIIEFSGLGEFIEMPVRTYSSGMHSKLAFAIAVTLETDIMLIDEVLSVGDGRFRKKSARKIKSMIENADRTVLIVSHNMSTIEELCTLILWIDKGKQIMFGPASEVLPKYEEFMK